MLRFVEGTRVAAPELFEQPTPRSEIGLLGRIDAQSQTMPNVRYADLDGHFDLVDDPAKGAVRFKDG